MTLKERILPLVADGSYVEITASTIEKIADEFAIGFAEWCSFYKDKNRNFKLDMLHAKSKYDESYTTKELLKIYKKEKGL